MEAHGSVVIRFGCGTKVSKVLRSFLRRSSPLHLLVSRAEDREKQGWKAKTGERKICILCARARGPRNCDYEISVSIKM